MVSTENSKTTSDINHKNKNFLNSTFKIYSIILTAIIILIVIGEILSPGFASIESVMNILALSSMLAAASIGQTLIIIAGNSGLDLSVESMLSMGALVGSILSGAQANNSIIAILGLIVLGGAIGLFNGLVIRFLHVPSFVLTMSMAIVIRGFIIAFTSGRPSGGTPKILNELSIGNIWGPIRWLFLLGIVITILVELLLRKTKYGKGLFLLGSNRNAAILTGININYVIILTYIIAGICTTLSGYILLGVVGSATIQIGEGYGLLSIAAVVIGGTQLSGGKGGFIGTYLGSILMIVLSSVLIAVNIESGLRTLIQGFILLVIIIMYIRSDKLRQ